MRNLLKTPGKEQVDCQHPKPILLDTGEMKKPYDWAVSYLFVHLMLVECGCLQKFLSKLTLLKFIIKNSSNLISGSGNSID